tara:strand:+ start:2090 stop:2572 length:483 start_codon:yes stop_codon:yes gene_type:complete
MSDFELSVYKKELIFSEIGLKISKARKLSRKKIDTVSKILKIKTSNLLAIEGGQYTSFSDEVYLKGFIKCYAGYLGSTINKTPLSYVKAICLAEKIFKLLPENTHDWNKFVSPNTVKTILASNGFKEIDFQGTNYNPIISKWSYINSLDTNYFFRARNES